MASAAASTERASAVERNVPEPACDAARELYERHSRRVFRFCLSRLRSREEAEDARQTTFLHAFRALRAGVVPIAESSWLLKIAENECKLRRSEALRRTAVEVGGPPGAIERLAAPAGAAPEVLLPLEAALARLTEPQRRALLLREWRGLSYREIAELLDIGRGAAEVLTFRARRSLAAKLEAPDARPRRSLRSLDLAWLAGGAKSAVGGGSVAVKAAAAVCVAAATATTLNWAVPREESRAWRAASPTPVGSLAALRTEPTRSAAGAALRAAPPPARATATETPALPSEPSPPPSPVAGPSTPDTPAAATKPPATRDEAATESPAPAVETATDSVPATLTPVTDAVASVTEPVESAAEPVTDAVSTVAGELTEAAAEAAGALPLEPALP